MIIQSCCCAGNPRRLHSNPYCPLRSADQRLPMPPDAPHEGGPYDEIMEVLQSLHGAIVFDSKDYSLNSRAAWIYGIVVGWGADEIDEDDALPEVAEKHGWSDGDVRRLTRLHRAVKRYKERWEGP